MGRQFHIGDIVHYCHRLVHYAEVAAHKGDSYKLKRRDLGRVRTTTGTED